MRAHLSDWLDRARTGGDVVITDRRIPIARLTGLDSAGVLERLTAESELASAERDWEEFRVAGRPVELTARVEQLVAVGDRRLHTGARAAGCRVAPAQLDP